MKLNWKVLKTIKHIRKTHIFHLKIRIESEELKKLNKIESSKKIYKILDAELKDHIHSIQILIN